MRFKKLFNPIAVTMLSLFTCMSGQASPKVIIKSELASPIVLENSTEPNYLKISLTGFPLEVKKRSPINLALVIDRSGSMSGDRIKKARDAAIMTVNMLNSDDTLSVVTYDDRATVIIPATKVTNKNKLIEAIKRNTNPQGMTALFAGVSKGIDQVSKNLDKEKINRVILLSDGQANVGPTSITELARLSKIAAQKGISISTIGLGEDYNEDLMTAIANYSDGNHAFVANVSDLEKIFNQEFKDVMSVVAQDVEVIIKTANGVKPIRLLGRDGEINGDTITVKLNQLYANQEKYILLEVQPPKGKANEKKDLAKVQVSYANLNTKKQDNYNENVALNYTQKPEVAKEAQIEEITVDYATQKAALENERAIQLMDAGRIEEAKSIIQDNVSSMERLSITSPAAKKKAEANIQANKDLLDTVETENKANSRKAIKASSYGIQKQQKNF